MNDARGAMASWSTRPRRPAGLHEAHAHAALTLTVPRKSRALEWRAERGARVVDVSLMRLVLGIPDANYVQPLTG